MVEFQWCKLFKDTFSDKAKTNPDLISTFDEFRKVKEQNPNQQFGSSDTSFNSNFALGQSVSKLRHAHLARDLSVCYTVTGKDPTVIKLYGVFKHDELGIGQPMNIKRQKNIGTTMSNQDFEPIPGEPKKTEPKKADDYKQSSWYKNQNK